MESVWINPDTLTEIHHSGAHRRKQAIYSRSISHLVCGGNADVLHSLYPLGGYPLIGKRGVNMTYLKSSRLDTFVGTMEL